MNINLTHEPNASERLKDICNNKDREHGTYIAYAEGDYGDAIGLTKVGITARRLSDEGRVQLFQKLLNKGDSVGEGRRYLYLARVINK